MKQGLLQTFKHPVFLLLAGLNVFACCFYFYFLGEVNYLGRLDEIIFSSSDSKEYIDYIGFFKGEQDYCNPNRPFFYPFLLLLLNGIGGHTAIWIFQFLLWLAACNLSFLSVFKMNGGKVLASVSFLLVATYYSAICLTMHGLTEIVIFFLLSLIAFVFSNSINNYNNPGFGLKIILLLSLLFATKPLFQIPLWLGFALFLLYYFKQLTKKPLILLWLVLCLSPALVQYGLNKTYHGVWKSEQTTALNLRQYLTNKVDYYEEFHDLESFDYLSDSVYKQRAAKMDRLSMGEVWSYLLGHLSSTLVVMYNNLELNIHGGHPYIDHINQKDIYIRSWKMNGRFFRFHRAMFILFFIYFFFVLFGKKKKEQFYFLSLAFLSFMILLLNGITFWVGDRLAVPAMAVWAVLYPLFIAHLLRSIFSNEKAPLHRPYLKTKTFVSGMDFQKKMKSEIRNQKIHEIKLGFSGFLFHVFDFDLLLVTRDLVATSLIKKIIERVPDLVDLSHLFVHELA